MDPFYAIFQTNPKNNAIQQHRNLKVDSLIDPITRPWCLDKLEPMFDNTTIQAILQLHPASYEHPDKLIWTPDSKGHFSVKSAYHLTIADQNPYQQPLMKKERLGIWKLKIHARLKLFLWKLAWDMLPTGQKLTAIGSSSLHVDPDICYICCTEKETLEHLFLDCPVQQIIWRSSSFPFILQNIIPRTIHELLRAIIDPKGKLSLSEADAHHFQLFAAVALDQVWMLCNKIRMNSFTSFDPIKLAVGISKFSSEHLKA